MSDTDPEILNEDPNERDVVYVVLPRWVVSVLREEARELGLTTRRGRPVSGAERGSEKGSLAMLLTVFARGIIERHMRERAGFTEHIEGTANLLDEESGTEG